MAGIMREYHMPPPPPPPAPQGRVGETDIPPSAPAGRTVAVGADAQETLFKKLRLEPIGRSILAQWEIDLLKKFKRDYKSLPLKDIVYYHILLKKHQKDDNDTISFFYKILQERNCVKEYVAWSDALDEYIDSLDADNKTKETTKKALIQAEKSFYNKLGDLAPPATTFNIQRDDETNLDTPQQTPRKTLPPPLTTSPAPPNAQLLRLEQDLDHLVRAGLSPLYNFVGMVATSLGDRDARSLYKWRGKGAEMRDLQSPVERGAADLNDFVRRNSHLGKPLLHYAMQMLLKENKDVLTHDSTQPALIEAHVPALIEDERMAMELIERNFTPQGANPLETQWTFGALDEALFTYLLNDVTVGAMRLAHNKLKRIPSCAQFTLKELILSDGVNDMFAKFVGWEFLQASGGNAYSKSVSQGKVKGTTFMLSAGFDTRQALFRQVECAQIWFGFVRRIDNPQIAELQAYEREQRVLVDNYEKVGQPGHSYRNLNTVRNLRTTLYALPQSGRTPDVLAYFNAKTDLLIAEEKLKHLPRKVLKYFE